MHWGADTMAETWFYNRLPVMHMLSGDTSKTFTIEVEGEITEDAAMQLMIASQTFPDKVLHTIDCERSGNLFAVRIPNRISASMHGTYYLDFRLTTGSMVYKRIRGLLEVAASPTGV